MRQCGKGQPGNASKMRRRENVSILNSDLSKHLPLDFNGPTWNVSEDINPSMEPVPNRPNLVTNLRISTAFRVVAPRHGARLVVAAKT